MSNNRHKKGFTLIEIIVASVLLAIIAAGVLSITVSSRKIINISSRRNYATEVGQAVLERLRNYLGADYWWNNTSPIYNMATGVWNCYNLTDTSTSLSAAISALFNSTEFDTKYKGKWCYRIENVYDCTWNPAPYQCDYRKAIVEVNWTEVMP